MKITHLLFKISSVLGRIEHKSFQLLDQSTDSEEEYVITQTENNRNLTLNDIEENDRNIIIQCMQSISKHRFQNLSSVIDFRSWFWSETPNDIPFDPSKRLIVKTSWLSDNEIEFGNNLSMAKFDKIGLYHIITSLQFQFLKNQSLVELFNNEYAVIYSKKKKNSPSQNI